MIKVRFLAEAPDTLMTIRQPKVWEAQVLTNSLIYLKQIEEKIVEIYKNSNAEQLSDLPPSMISTDLLYAICKHYEILYLLLEKQGIVKTKPQKFLH